MSFNDEALKNQKQVNIVLKIDGEYWAKYQPDSGMVIDASRLGLISKVSTNPVSVDIRNVRTPIASLSFTLLDKEGFVSAEIMKRAGNYLETEVELYVGYITGSFDFADYIKFNDTRIKSIGKRTNEYSFKCQELTDLINSNIFDDSSELDTAISDVDTSLDVINGDIYPISGRIKMNQEFIQYSGKTTNTLTGLSRGDLNSSAAAHAAGSDVFLVQEVEDNPIDIILQILTSVVGDTTNGPYDLIPQGALGIDEALIDVATFEQIRDDFFDADSYRFYYYDVGNALKELESELLKAVNCRFVTKNGLISLAVLDQIDITAVVPEINEDTSLANPSWALNSNKVVNYITLKYDYNEGLKQYVRTQVFKDDDSIATFGLKSLNLNFKGIRADLNGSAIAANRASRLLSRLSTPRGDISIKTHFDNYDLGIGDKVLVTQRYLPQQGGGLGMSEQLEVVSKGLDLESAILTFKLDFTSFSGIRIGLIAPAPFITTVISQTEFEIPDVGCYRVGDTIALSADINDLRTITEIDDGASTLIIGVAFSTTATTSHRIKLPDYNNASEFQRSRYAFVAPDSGEFDDATKAYQIIF